MVIPTVVAPLLQNAILLYCGWQTFKVLETERSNDDTHWLTFWFVHSLFEMINSILEFVAYIIPFYTEITIGIIVYLGFFGGATHVYGTFLKPLLKQHEAAIDDLIAQGKAKANDAMNQATNKAQDLLKNQALKKGE